MQAWSGKNEQAQPQALMTDIKIYFIASHRHMHMPGYEVQHRTTAEQRLSAH
jgi:hypothetical protein